MTRGDKEDPVVSIKANWPVLVLLAGQTLTGIWWASTVTADVRYMGIAIQTLTTDVKNIQMGRYTSADATRDFARCEDVVSKLERRVSEIERCEVFNRCMAMKGAGK